MAEPVRVFIKANKIADEPAQIGHEASMIAYGSKQIGHDGVKASYFKSDWLPSHTFG